MTGGQEPERVRRHLTVASGRQLWALNKLLLLREALERTMPVTSAVAHELLAKAKEEGRW